MIFLKKSKIYISAVVLFGMAMSFVFVGCQEESILESERNRIINVTAQQVKDNNGGLVYFSIPENILVKGEIAVKSFIENLESEDITELGEKRRVANYLQSIGEIKLAEQLTASNNSITDFELSSQLSKKEIQELNSHVINNGYKGTGCYGDVTATHVSDLYGCYRNGEAVTTGYVYQCVNGNWSFVGTAGYDDPPCADDYNSFISSTYCNLDGNKMASPSANKQAELARFVAKEADNQLKDVIYYYIRNKSEIDNLLENDPLVKSLYSDFSVQTTLLYTRASINNQNPIVDTKVIEATQALFSSLAESVQSKELGTAFSKFSNSLDVAKGKELNAALRMIDDFE